jgi:hypothetical protein
VKPPQTNRPRMEKFATLREPRPRRLTIAGLLAAIILAVFGTAAGISPAHAATASSPSTARFAAAATSFQNKVIDSAMTTIPGGTRVSTDEVTWDSSRISLRVAANASETPDNACPSGDQCDSNGCPDGSFCVYSQTDFSAPSACAVYVAGAPPLWFDWGEYSSVYCGDDGTWSWDNNRGYRTWKEQDYSGGTYNGGYYWSGGTGSGNTWCISPDVSNSDVGDTQTRTDGWIYLSSNTSACS